MTSEVPVLIVGGGAVGSVLSMELARRGIEYRCIDRMPGPGRESRAIALHARTIELMDLVDPALSKSLLDRDLWCRGYVMHFLRDGERTEVRPGLDYTTVDSRYNCILSHNQSETEGFVREYTRSRFGSDIEYNTTFQSLTQDGGEVTAHVTHDDRGDEEELIRCQYLIAADGINSRVRRGLGLSVKGKDYTGSFFQNLDIHLNGFTDWTRSLSLLRRHRSLPDGGAAAWRSLPSAAERSRRGRRPTLTPQQAFMRLLSKHFDGITMGEVVWHSRWETWVRLADTFREGGVFLAGDSAHVHSTTGGQGMNCCMQDAFNLGMEARARAEGTREAGSARHLRGRAPAGRRAGDLGGVVAARHLHDARQGHRAAQADDVRAWVYGEGRELLLRRGLHIQGLPSRNRRGSTEIDGPAIGDRAPDIDFENGGTLFDRLRHEYFTLLVMPGSDGPAPAASVEKRFGAVVKTEVLPKSAALSRRYGPSDGRVFLVRPDGYVAFKSTVEEAGRLDAHLGQMLRS